MKIVVEWPDSAFADVDEAVSTATRALSDASKALGVLEPKVRAVEAHEDFRDAGTGEFVSERQALDNPGTTVHET